MYVSLIYSEIVLVFAALNSDSTSHRVSSIGALCLVLDTRVTLIVLAVGVRVALACSSPLLPPHRTTPLAPRPPLCTSSILILHTLHLIAVHRPNGLSNRSIRRGMATKTQTRVVWMESRVVNVPWWTGIGKLRRFRVDGVVAMRMGSVRMYVRWERVGLARDLDLHRLWMRRLGSVRLAERVSREWLLRKCDVEGLLVSKDCLSRRSILTWMSFRRECIEHEVFGWDDSVGAGTLVRRDQRGPPVLKGKVILEHFSTHQQVRWDLLSCMPCRVSAARSLTNGDGVPEVGVRCSDTTRWGSDVS